MENMNQEERNVDMEQTTKKTVRRKKAAQETRKGDNKLVIMAVAFLAAIVVFVVMVAVESHLVNSAEKKTVIVAMTSVPKGMVLTEENMPNYFSMEERAVSELPANAYESGIPLKGKVLSRDISANEVITPSCIYEEDFYAAVEDPVEISIEVSKIGQAVGGILRPGDLVDIKVVVEIPKEEDDLMEGVNGENTLTDVPDVSITEDLNAEEIGTITDEQNGDLTDLYTPDLTQQDIDNMSGGVNYDLLGGGIETLKLENLVHSVTGNYACAPVAENVRVTNVFNSAGQDALEAEAAGTTHVATVINVVVPRSTQDVIYLALEEGTLRLSRVASDDLSETEESEVIVEESAVGEVVEGSTIEESATVQESITEESTTVEESAAVEESTAQQEVQEGAVAAE